MRIGIASDHAGVDYKSGLSQYLVRHRYDVVDFGTYSTESVDYPDFAHALAKGVEDGTVDVGIALCGTGNGMAITLNHHKGIRAGLAWNKKVAELVKQHNNTNILVIPARFVSFTMARIIVKSWLNATFEGGRHQRRIDKITCG